MVRMLLLKNKIFSSGLLAFVFACLNFTQQLSQTPKYLSTSLFEFVIVWIGFILLIYGLRHVAVHIIYILDGFVKWENRFYSRFLIGLGMMLLQTLLMVGALLFVMIYVIDIGGSDILSVQVWVWLTMIFALISIAWIMEEVQFMYKKRQELILMNEQLQKEQALSHLQSLKNQLKPHFLFNSFNVLSNLIHTDPNRAESFVIALSKVYRYVLELSEEMVVPLERELVFMESFFFLQKIRFEENLKITSHVDSDKKHYLVPPLSLELLAENAIKHNVISKEHPLELEMKTENDFLIVRNSYQPKKGDRNAIGKGLKNLSERLKLLGMSGFTAKVEGAFFVARIPLLKKINV